MSNFFNVSAEKKRGALQSFSIGIQRGRGGIQLSIMPVKYGTSLVTFVCNYKNHLPWVVRTGCCKMTGYICISNYTRKKAKDMQLVLNKYLQVIKIRNKISVECWSFHRAHFRRHKIHFLKNFAKQWSYFFTNFLHNQGRGRGGVTSMH